MSGCASSLNRTVTTSARSVLLGGALSCHRQNRKDSVFQQRDACIVPVKIYRTLHVYAVTADCDGMTLCLGGDVRGRMFGESAKNTFVCCCWCPQRTKLLPHTGCLDTAVCVCLC